MVGPTARWGPWEPALAASSDPVADEALLRRAQERAMDLLADLPSDPTPGNPHWGLVHADLRPSNIMAASDGSLTVIDFDDCGFGYYLYDFAAALTFVEYEPYAPAMAQAWVAGYREVAPLSHADLVHACALSMLRRVQMLGWTTGHRPDALPAGLFDAQLPGALECANRFLADTLWLLR